MCFSAEASFGAAAALVPAGAYCVAAAWRKCPRYLPLAAIPVLFGLQQLCEGLVWVALGRGQTGAAAPALAYLFFALAVWPVWVPLAVAAVEPRGPRRWGIAAAALVGVAFGWVYFVPFAAAGWGGVGAAVVGCSIRYDLSVVPAAAGAGEWAWPALYLAAVAGPLFMSRHPDLRRLGVGVLVSVAAAYSVSHTAFASVWCFFAAVLSLHLAYALHRLPGAPAAPEPITQFPEHGVDRRPSAPVPSI